MNIYNEMLDFSTQVYSNDNNFEFFIDDKKTCLQVGITTKENRIIVSFRGTESSRDMFYDMLTFKKEINNVGIHYGFYKHLFSKSNYISMINKINSLLNENLLYEIYITGHSLGGALATLFGYKLSQEFSNIIVNIVTFASPKVGDRRWRNLFNSIKNINYTRIVINNDPVILFPFINYYHVGKILELKSNSRFYNLDDHTLKSYKKYLNLIC
jgi:predicted lipase